MTMPNELISFRFEKKTFNSETYIEIMSENAVPIMKLNYNGLFYFQQDNARPNISSQTKNGITTYSPDLNIVKDL